MSELIEDLMMLADKCSEDDPADELGLLLVRAVGQTRGYASSLAAKDARIAELEGLLRERRETDGAVLFLNGEEKQWAAKVDSALASQQKAEPCAICNDHGLIGDAPMECPDCCTDDPATPSEDGGEVQGDAELIAFVLREIGSMDSDDITGDDVDLRFEDAEGRDTGCDVSIVEYAEKAADLIQHLRSARDAYAQNAIDLQRIVAAKDAEIARITIERDAWIERSTTLQAEIDAQPAQKDEHVRAARLGGR